MRIAMITGWFLSKKKGSGASVFIKELKTGLERKGMQVDLITPQYLSVQNYYLATIGRIYKNFLLRFKSFDHYDLVVGFDYDGFILPNKIKAPFVCMPRGVFRDIVRTEKGFSRFFVWLQGFLEQKNLSKSFHVISNSRYAKAQIKKYYSIKENKISVVYTGIDINSRLSSGRNIQQKNKKNIRLLAVGKMYPRKNIPLLVKVFNKVHEKLPDTELHLVGDGLEFEKVNQLREKSLAKNNIIMHGYVGDPSTLKNIYLNSDVVCHFAKQETFGNVVLEALALGKPVFAFNVASLPEQIKDRYNGLLFDNMDINKTAKKICDCLREAGAVSKMSQNALKSSERFTKEKMIENFHRLFLNITNQKEKNDFVHTVS